MIKWLKRQRAYMHVTGEWGYLIDGQRMVAGYCVIAPLLHFEMPWWFIPLGLLLCINTPSVTYLPFDDPKK